MLGRKRKRRKRLLRGRYVHFCWFGRLYETAFSDKALARMRASSQTLLLVIRI